MLRTLLTTATMMGAGAIAAQASAAVIVNPMLVQTSLDTSHLITAGQVSQRPFVTLEDGNRAIAAPARTAASRTNDTPSPGSALLLATSVGTVGVVMIRRKDRNVQAV